VHLLLTMAKKNRGRNPKRAKREKNAVAGFKDLAPLFRSPSSIVHHHVRTWEYGTLGRAAADQGYSMSFALSDLANSSEFTNLYDHYKIAMVEVILELVNYGSATVAPSSLAQPTILMTPDYDNTTVPATLSVLQQYGQADRHCFSTAKPSFSRRLVPKYAVATTSTAAAGVTGTVIPTKSDFLDCTYPSVAHYGIKFWLINYNTLSVTNTGTVIEMSFRYHLQMRNTR